MKHNTRCISYNSVRTSDENYVCICKGNLPMEEKLKQVLELESILSQASLCLVGHNGDCECDFCNDKDTSGLKMKVCDLYGQIIMTRIKLQEEN